MGSAAGKARRTIQADLQPRLPDVSVRIGGATSIDITRAGVDKAYGMERLAELWGFAKSEMLFFGDALYPGGNDAPVREAAGIDSVQVYDVDQTKRALEAVLLCLGRSAAAIGCLESASLVDHLGAVHPKD